jgi:superfamily II DNA or RNA helicase
MATIVKTPSGTWKAVIRKTGWPTNIKTFRTKRDAEDWSRRTEDEMVRGTYIQRATADRLTLANALERYRAEITPTKRPSTQEGELRRAAILTRHLGKYSLAALNQEIIARFRDMRLAGEDRKDENGRPIPRANNTVRLELALLGHLFSNVDDEDVDPWMLPPSKARAEREILGPFPARVQVVRSNLVYVEKDGLPPAMLNRLLRLAAFQNPEFYKSQAMRLPTFNKPRVIACGEDLANYIALPRGCIAEVIQLLEAHRIKTVIDDKRFAGRPIDVEFSGQLRPVQLDAAAMIAEHDDGILCAPTAFGKTALAAWMIATRKVNTLVLVHRQQLLDQWHARLEMFLNLPKKSIGQIGGGKSDPSGCIDIAIIQSTHDKAGVKDFVAEYGQVIVDECHHLSAFTFEQVMKQVKAKYVLGLTATPERKDGHHPIIYMQCGPIRYKLSARSMTASSPFEHEVIPRLTEFRSPPEQADTTIQELYAALVNDNARNELIVSDLMRVVQDGCSPLVLTARTEHLTYFGTALAGKVENVFVLKGGMGKKQRRLIAEAIAAVPESAPRVILATGSYIGEGFDDARLDTLFLAMPISWKGTLQQYVGRLHRLYDAKRVVRVYDYVDSNVQMLARMYARRLKGYSAIGYRICNTPYDVFGR